MKGTHRSPIVQQPPHCPRSPRAPPPRGARFFRLPCPWPRSGTYFPGSVPGVASCTAPPRCAYVHRKQAASRTVACTRVGVQARLCPCHCLFPSPRAPDLGVVHGTEAVEERIASAWGRGVCKITAVEDAEQEGVVLDLCNGVVRGLGRAQRDRVAFSGASAFVLDPPARKSPRTAEEVSDEIAPQCGAGCSGCSLTTGAALDVSRIARQRRVSDDACLCGDHPHTHTLNPLRIASHVDTRTSSRTRSRVGIAARRTAHYRQYGVALFENGQGDAHCAHLIFQRDDYLGLALGLRELGSRWNHIGVPRRIPTMLQCKRRAAAGRLATLRVARIQLYLASTLSSSVASSRAPGSSSTHGGTFFLAWHASSSTTPRRQLSQASSCLRATILPGLALMDAVAPKMGLLARRQILRACWAPQRMSPIRVRKAAGASKREVRSPRGWRRRQGTDSGDWGWADAERAWAQTRGTRQFADTAATGAGGCAYYGGRV
ncbi:hypothetical protein GGX14DRAFT_634240 [Mycena pura]|uniref:Uncharacterized protein n=1 Tax=Mycena pura TaxID=153505 RepID=A0AAD6VBE4_9AGAR|nr:hypothetical protein GGX14DRAFT_634240 [Mycena pura]